VEIERERVLRRRNGPADAGAIDLIAGRDRIDRARGDRLDRAHFWRGSSALARGRRGPSAPARVVGSPR
jgi:hypothetical protein